MPMAKCKSCGAKILWVKSFSSHKMMPIDAEATKEGNIALVEREGEETVFHVISGSSLLKSQREGKRLHTSHFATCPDAKRHRR